MIRGVSKRVVKGKVNFAIANPRLDPRIVFHPNW